MCIYIYTYDDVSFGRRVNRLLVDSWSLFASSKGISFTPSESRGVGLKKLQILREFTPYC